MPAAIRIGTIVAVVTHSRWKCGNASLQKLLQAMVDPDGPRGSDPNPDHTLAVQAAAALGATVLSSQSPNPK